MRALKIRLWCIVEGLFFLAPVFSQSQDLQLRDGVMSSYDYNTLMISADYYSNTNVMGMFNATTRQPSYSPAATFFSKWGVDFSAGGYFLDNSDDSLENFTSELDLWIGYNFRPAENLTIYPSYTHYFYSNNSNSLKSLFSDDFQLDIDYQYRFINFGASAGYYLGKQDVFYAALHNYYQIDIKRFLFRNVSLTMLPGWDANFGSYEYLNQYYLDELREEPYFYAYLLTFPAIRRYVYHELRSNPDLTYKEVLDNYLEDQAQDNFKLTSLSINLPVYIIWGNFGLNVGLYALIPFGQPDYLTDDTQFFINIGLTYNLMFR